MKSGLDRFHGAPVQAGSSGLKPGFCEGNPDRDIAGRPALL
jgi:hypothetical protein